jgi:WhiB family redox-sensing transcriptional regulator
VTRLHRLSIGGHDLYGEGPHFLSEIADRPPFMDGSELCAQTDPEVFFPEKGGSTAEAKRVCADCPLQDPCLTFALVHNERFGIWGGRSERERRGMKPPAQDQPEGRRIIRRKPRASQQPPRSCEHKTRYPTHAAAVAAARRVTPDHRHAANHLTIAACSTCDGFYLTDKDAA